MWTRRTHEHLAIIIRTVHHLVFGGDRLDLGLVIAKVGKVAEGQIFHTMAASTDFLIDLEATLHGSLVEIAERPGKAPLARDEFHITAASRLGWAGKTNHRRQRGNGCNQKLAHQAAPFAVASTGSEIDFGSGLVVSKILSSGRIARKCRKYQAVAIRESRT